MDDPHRLKSFVSLLQRFQESNQLAPEDWQVIPSLNVIEPNRKEHDVPSEMDRPHTLNEYFRAMPAPSFPSLPVGLQKLGWSSMPYYKMELGKGFFGRVFLAFRVSDPRPIESKQLVAVKLQKLAENNAFESVWSEIACLKGCVHQNIIGYFGHFYIVPVVSHNVQQVARSEVVLLMEYANAGDLWKEIKRFPNWNIPEKHARYYMLQILDGLRYLHSRWIIHGDLHAGNIVLKYNPDLSKTCMICDFGISDFVAMAYRDSHSYRRPFIDDVQKAITLLKTMLVGIPYAGQGQRPTDHLSPMALKAINPGFVTTIDDLLMSPWFAAGPPEPFIASQQTPLFARRSLQRDPPNEGSGEGTSKQPPHLRRMTQLKFDPVRDTMGYRPSPSLAQHAARKKAGIVEEYQPPEDPYEALGAVGGAELPESRTPSPAPLVRRQTQISDKSGSSSSLSSGIQSFNRQFGTQASAADPGQQQVLRLPVRKTRARGHSPEPSLAESAHQAVESGLEEVRAGSSSHPSIGRRIGRSLSSIRVALGRGVRRMNCFGRHEQEPGGSGRDSGRGETMTGSRSSPESGTGELRRAFMK